MREGGRQRGFAGRWWPGVFFRLRIDATDQLTRNPDHPALVPGIRRETSGRGLRTLLAETQDGYAYRLPPGWDSCRPTFPSGIFSTCRCWTFIKPLSRPLHSIYRPLAGRMAARFASGRGGSPASRNAHADQADCEAGRLRRRRHLPSCLLAEKSPDAGVLSQTFCAGGMTLARCAPERHITRHRRSNYSPGRYLRDFSPEMWFVFIQSAHRIGVGGIMT